MLNFGASKPRVKGGGRGPPWIRTWLERTLKKLPQTSLGEDYQKTYIRKCRQF